MNIKPQRHGWPSSWYSRESWNFFCGAHSFKKWHLKTFKSNIHKQSPCYSTEDRDYFFSRRSFQLLWLMETSCCFKLVFKLIINNSNIHDRHDKYATLKRYYLTLIITRTAWATFGFKRLPHPDWCTDVCVIFFSTEPHPLQTKTNNCVFM